MAQVQNQLEGLTFSYENEASANFLVALCESKLIEYQVQMLEHNLIRHVISPVMVRKEGVNHFYYNITSKIPLSFMLKRHKLSREAFLRLLLQITSAVNDSSGYLLGISNFIIDPEYIYINPETLEPSLVYVPAAINQNGCEAIRCFISELLLAHIHVDGFDRGNMVQKILSAVNSDIFNIKVCVALMNELMYGQEMNEGMVQPEEAIQSTGSIQPVRSTHPTVSVKPSRARREDSPAVFNDKKDKKEEKNTIKENKRTNGNKSVLITIGAVLLQFVMGGLIYMNRGFLKSIGDNQTATFAAVAMIVLAVDVLLFKKITDAKLIQINSKQEPKITPELLKEEVKYAADPKLLPIREMAEQNEIPAGGTEKVICKTELLVNDKKGCRILRSTGKHSGDEDIIIDKDDFIIGRLAEHVDYILKNNAVGKLHAELIYRNGTCFVKDLNTVNGTFINNTRIDSNKEVELKESDRLQLANSEFVLTYS